MAPPSCGKRALLVAPLQLLTICLSTPGVTCTCTPRHGSTALHSTRWLLPQVTASCDCGTCAVLPPRPTASVHIAHHSALANGIAECQLLAAGECGSLLLLDTRQLDAPVATVRVSASSAVSAIAPEDTAPQRLLWAPRMVPSRSSMPVTSTSSHVRTHQGRVSALAWLVGPSSGDGGGELLSGGWDKQLLRQRMSKA